MRKISSNFFVLSADAEIFIPHIGVETAEYVHPHSSLRGLQRFRFSVFGSYADVRVSVRE